MNKTIIQGIQLKQVSFQIQDYESQLNPLVFALQKVPKTALQ